MDSVKLSGVSRDRRPAQKDVLLYFAINKTIGIVFGGRRLFLVKVKMATWKFWLSQFLVSSWYCALSWSGHTRDLKLWLGKNSLHWRHFDRFQIFNYIFGRFYKVNHSSKLYQVVIHNMHAPSSNFVSKFIFSPVAKFLKNYLILDQYALHFFFTSAWRPAIAKKLKSFW